MLTLMLGLNGPLNFCNNFDPINLKSMRSHSLRAKKISYCEGEDNGITITIRNLPDVEIAIVQTSPPHLTWTRGNQPSRLEADTPSPGPGADTPWTRGRYPPDQRHTLPSDQRQTHPWTRGRHHRPRERRPLQRAERIPLECILVLNIK